MKIVFLQEIKLLPYFPLFFQETYKILQKRTTMNISNDT